jgi:hypothetical protein
MILSLPAFAQSQLFTFEQGVAGFTGFSDTTLFSESNHNGGGTDGIFSGTISQLTFDGQKQNRRGLIRIDLTSIPRGWIIEDASLQMTVQMSGGNFGDFDFSLHRVRGSWGEGDEVGPSGGGFGAPAQQGDATWYLRELGISPWNAPGGDFVSSPSATAAAGLAGSDVVWSGAGLIADVQLWVNAPVANDGWLILSSLEGQQQRVKKFHSSEATQFRPVLTVLAQPAPPLGNSAYQVPLLCVALAMASLGAICRARTTR